MNAQLRDYITDLLEDHCFYYGAKLHKAAFDLTEDLQKKHDPPIPDRADLIFVRDRRYTEPILSYGFNPDSPYTNYAVEEGELKHWESDEIDIWIGYLPQTNKIIVKDTRRPRTPVIKQVKKTWKNSEYLKHNWRTTNYPPGSLWRKVEQFGKDMRDGNTK